MSLRRLLLPLLTVFVLLPSWASAQILNGLSDGKPQGNILQQLSGDLEPAEPAKFKAWFKVQEGSRRGVLSLKAEMDAGWHVYSLTQPKNGPGASKIKVGESSDFKVLGPFQPDRPPHVKPPDVFPVPSEEHAGEVTWSAPIELAEGIEPESLEIALSYSGQVCKDACIPINNRKVPVEFAGYEPVKEATGEYRPSTAKLTLKGHFEPKTAVPGGKVRLSITAIPDPNWHVYAYETEDNAAVAKPTLIVLTGMKDWQAATVKASSKPKVKAAQGPNLPEERYHEEPVTWTLDFTLPQDVQKGEHVVSGMVGFQTCETGKSCLPPSGANFRAVLPIGDQATDGMIPLQFEAGKYAEVAKWAKEVAAAQVAAKPPVREVNWGTLMPMLGFAALGGLILNLMPCVLPVLGLKLLSFAKQAGQHRSRVILLNLSYTAGLMSVFLALATLVAFANLGWGEQFTHLWFRVGVTGLVFVMALSFLGVWELPIPGFATSGKASELQNKGGLEGAFFKGVFTTVIATPCSGPFLGSVLGFTLDQPPLAIFLIFTAAGLGMASPYLLVGLFPGLSRIIPKPGAWMETFERLLGFLMLVAVVVQMSTIGSEYYTATLLLLVGLSFACWLIGRVPEYADRWRIANTWVIATCLAAMVGFLSFSFLGPPDKNRELPWQPFSRQTLAQLQTEGKTVLVDFTADWCLTCQYNSRVAINTSKVLDVVKQNDVVPLLADWTNPSDEIKSMLVEHDSNSIPLLVVYPAGRPGEAIVLRDTLVEQQVIDALQQAGPSQQPSSPGAVTAQAQKNDPAG